MDAASKAAQAARDANTNNKNSDMNPLGLALSQYVWDNGYLTKSAFESILAQYGKSTNNVTPPPTGGGSTGGNPPPSGNNGTGGTGNGSASGGSGSGNTNERIVTPGNDTVQPANEPRIIIPNDPFDENLDKFIKALQNLRENIDKATKNYSNNPPNVNSTNEALNIILSYKSDINRIAKELGIDPAFIQAILYQEIRFFNIGDYLADDAVSSTITYYKSLDQYNSMPWWAQIFLAPPTTFPLVYDSSTGFGQIFATTAIEANNWYIKNIKGYGDIYDINNRNDVFTMWENLQDNYYNIEKVGEVLLYKASLLDLIDYDSKTLKTGLEEQNIKNIFDAYNGRGQHAVDYGNAVYEYYLAFKQYNA